VIHTFAYHQMMKLEKLLASNVGVKQVTVGNTTIAYEDLLKQYDYWKRKVARENGCRPRASQINLSNF
jgi:hypothetical protein